MQDLTPLQVAFLTETLEFVTQSASEERAQEYFGVRPSQEGTQEVTLRQKIADRRKANASDRR